MTDEHKWFYLGADDIPQGPVDREQLLELVRTGNAGFNALVWRDGFSGWRPFRELEEEITKPAGESGTPAPARRVTPTPAALSQVSQVAAATREVAAATKARISEPLNRLSAAVRARPGISKQHLAVGAAFAMAAVVIVSTLYSYSGPVSSDEPPTVALPSVPELPFGDDALHEPLPVPVRVQNPFDKSEFFEFPPGTSEVEARDAVADLLMKRAMERRAIVSERRSRKKST